MKVLTLTDMYFKLPDDFEGGLSDALNLLAEYHDKVKGTDTQRIGVEETGISITETDPDIMWQKFIEMLNKKDGLVVGFASISEQKGGKMVEIENSLTK